MAACVIERRVLPKGRRILVVSDIHGALDYLRGLLEQLRFCEDDLLILNGDMLEKGPRSLDTLRYIVRLSRTHAVWPVMGNCDGLERLFLDAAPVRNFDAREFMVNGRAGWQTGLLRQMARSDITVSTVLAGSGTSPFLEQLALGGGGPAPAEGRRAFVQPCES